MSKEKKILIVDDSKIDRLVLENVLGDEFDVLEADSGTSGLKMILKNKDKLDAVLLDVSMPGMDGFSVLKTVRHKHINVPVFMITVEATQENVEKAAQYNIAGFISKPFEREELLKRLKEKLDIPT